MYADLITAILALLQDDATLTALLAAPNAIYYHRPVKLLGLPCLTYYLEDAWHASYAPAGRVTLTLTLDIWSLSADTNDAILAALDAALVDAHREADLDTETWKVALCRRTESRVADSGLSDNNGRPLEQRRTKWRLELMRKPAA